MHVPRSVPHLLERTASYKHGHNPLQQQLPLLSHVHLYMSAAALYMLHQRHSLNHKICREAQATYVMSG